MSRPRGRPPGSLGKKKAKELLSQSQPQSQSNTPRHMDHFRESQSDPEFDYVAPTVDVDEDKDSLTDRLDSAIKKAMEGMSTQLLSLKKELHRELKAHSEEIKKLKAENIELKERTKQLKGEVDELFKLSQQHTDQLNKNERFLRKNNIRIVGFKQESEEDCVVIAREVFRKIGVEDVQIERAHRDGRKIQGRQQHILVKMQKFQDKLYILKHSKQALGGCPYHVIDDLTRLDLQEKKKWNSEVTELYNSGTHLRFFRGKWRKRDGSAYDFPS